MRGHRSIMEARMGGYKPTAIFFEVGEPARVQRFAYGDPEASLQTGQHARVELSLKEPWRTADMRFVTGCHVHVHAAAWTDELTGLAEKIAANGAAQIIVACPHHHELLHYKNGEWHAYAS